MQPESHDYLGNRNNWWSQNRRTSATSVDVKLVPPAVATAALVSGGIADAGSNTIRIIDAARTEATDVWAGKVVKFTSGTNSGLYRTITLFDPVTDTINFAPAVPTAVGAGDTYDIVESVLTYRLVVTGYHITGVNTGAAFADVIFRHKINTTNVLLDAFVPATNGSLNISNGRCWLPMEENESLEMLIGGTLTAGVVAFTFWGKVFPSTTPLAMKYLGNETNPA